MDGDIDVQAQNGTLSAYWSGFYDFEATISHYLVAAGTGSSGAELEDVVAFTNVGRVNAWTSTPEQLLVTLAKGVKYFVTVRAGWCVPCSWSMRLTTPYAGEGRQPHRAHSGVVQRWRRDWHRASHAGRSRLGVHAWHPSRVHRPHDVWLLHRQRRVL